jgi:protein SCO1/2
MATSRLNMRSIKYEMLGPRRAELSSNLKTLAATLTLLAAWIGLISHITDGFRYWTFESLRARDSRELKLVAPRSSFLSSTNAVTTIWDGSRPDAIYIVDFIYTSCPTICQILGSSSQQIQANIAAQSARYPQITLLSISIDIDRDDPSRLRSYAKRFDADPRYWSVVVPEDKPSLGNLLRRLGVVAIPDGSGGFVHNGDLQIIDGAGRIRGLYSATDWRQALTKARFLARVP